MRCTIQLRVCKIGLILFESEYIRVYLSILSECHLFMRTLCWVASDVAEVIGFLSLSPDPAPPPPPPAQWATDNQLLRRLVAVGVVAAATSAATRGRACR